jgi:hypothetical protein
MMMFGLYVLLTFLTLVLAAAVSRSGGRQLWFALVAIGWVVGQFNTLLEAVVFSVMPWQHAVVQLAISAAVLSVLAAIAVLLVGKWRTRHLEAIPLDSSLKTLALIILAYELLYWTAGTFVWPFVAHFYADKAIPSVLVVFALQVPRALIFVAAAWPWLRTNPRWAPLVLGLAYAMIGGIAPMFPDNPYMTPDVRLAHGIETGSSNFLFGIIAGWLLTRKAVRAEAAAKAGGAVPI